MPWSRTRCSHSPAAIGKPVPEDARGRRYALKLARERTWEITKAEKTTQGLIPADSGTQETPGCPDKGKSGLRGDNFSTEAAPDKWFLRDKAWPERKQGNTGREGGIDRTRDKRSTIKVGAAILLKLKKKATTRNQ